MALPIIDRPTYTFTIPSTGNNAKFRSMTIKEEKILLVAKEDEGANEILNAIVQIVKNCCVDNDVQVEKLPLFDIEFLFLKIRSISVSNIAKMSFTESWEDDGKQETKTHDFEIDLAEVAMQVPENNEKLIKVNEDIGIELQYPPVLMNLSKEYQNAKTEAEVMDILIRNSIKSIYDGDSKITDFTRDELQTFVDSLPSSFFEQVTTFFEKQPSLHYELKYVDHNGDEQKIELRTLTDFFTF